MGNKRQRQRQGSNCKDIGYKPSICSNCGELGAHFCPPCFGEPGFFSCSVVKDGKAVRDIAEGEIVTIHTKELARLPKGTDANQS